MELFESRDHFIIQNGEHALWCNRFDGSLVARRGEDICTAWNPICMGRIYGVIGKIKAHPDTEWKLLLIRQQVSVGTLPGNHEVFKVKKISILPLCLEEPKDLEIELCPKHHFGISKSQNLGKVPETQQRALQKTWNSIKSAAENVKPKKLPFKIPQALGDIVITQDQREIKEKEKFERRVIEELNRMFTDSDSFYYSPTGDLTNSIQVKSTRNPQEADLPRWALADDRFFYNKYMLQELLNSKNPLADPWLVPVIQGYVQIETCAMDLESEKGSSLSLDNQLDIDMEFKLCLISRRSRFRAGTRYKRRGVDEEGHCANYVESEQILEFSNHVVSFVQIRGSVPLYWSQTGIKYKPPPRIEKGNEDNQAAFMAHFADEIALYQHVTAINLVDQVGKEKVIADTFLRHVLTFNCPGLTYVAFDFHEYCRGMKFENVSILTENIIDVIKEMRYCWVDKSGVICEQRGVFRSNCIDCLDRTNIVQSAIARVVLEVQCRKLGLLPPDEQLPRNVRSLYQQIWANNGDAISRQYAGTAALKGDYTRTGERKFTGLMKDGMNSANRYYRNLVKDSYRQAVINLLHGVPVDEDLTVLSRGTENNEPPEEDEAVLVEKEENLKTLIDESKKMLITEPEECLGGWGLIDCDPVTGDPTQQDMDIILLLSQKAYYVAEYDDETDQVMSYQRISLDDLEKIEIGPAPAVFKSKHLCIRIWYCQGAESGYFHAFRTTSTRLFNNIVIVIKNEEEAKESLRAITESFTAAKKLMGHDLNVVDSKLERKKSKAHSNVINIASQAQESMNIMPRANISAANSETNLKSPQALRKDVVPDKLPPKTGPRLNLLNIQKTFGSLNPVKKIKFNRLKSKVPSFLPSVWYTKDEQGQDRGSRDSLEHAKILKGDRIADGYMGIEISVPKRASVTETDGKIQVSGEPSDSESDLEIDTQGQDNHIVLESCGILATKPSQVIHSLLVDKKSRSVAEITSPKSDFLAEPEKDHSGSGSISPSATRKSPLTLQAKSRSLDIEEKQRRALVKSWSPETCKLPSPRRKRKGKATSPSRDILLNSNAEPAQNSTIKTGNELLPDAVAESTQFRSLAMQGNDSTSTLGSLEDQDVFINPLAEEEAGAEQLEARQHPSRPPKVQLYHPCMKMSFSEGSIAATYQSNLEEVTLDLDDLDDLEPGNLTNFSPFSKLKVKMSNLALPNVSSPASKRKAMSKVARQNKLKSQLRFQECLTKVLLL